MWFLGELLPHCSYSSREAAEADLAKLKECVTELELDNP
jgi:hypothetical protein